MATTIRSRKAKGQKLQKEVVMKLRKKYGYDEKETSCFSGDIQAQPMGMSGVDIKLSPLAQEEIPYDIECKNVERPNIWAWIKQAEDNCGETRTPLVIFKKNNSKTYAIIELDELLD